MSDNMAYEFSKSIKKPSSPYNRVWWLFSMVRKLFGFQYSLQKGVVRVDIDRMQRLQYQINDFNGIALKRGLKTRLAIQNGVVVIGSEAQLSYGNYQCVIEGDYLQVLCAVRTMIKMLCFEFGEQEGQNGICNNNI